MKEYQVITVLPNKCTNCEECMTFCSFVHSSKYIPLEKRVIGARMRVEPEWAISCDLCEGMKEEFVDPETGKCPQCIQACGNLAIYISTIEALESESRMEAIKRVFNLKK